MPRNPWLWAGIPLGFDASVPESCGLCKGQVRSLQSRWVAVVSICALRIPTEKAGQASAGPRAVQSRSKKQKEQARWPAPSSFSGLRPGTLN